MAPPNESSVSFGQTAMSLGYVTDVQVRECLGIQAKMREMGIDEPLGEILVKKRYLSAPQHQAVLKKLGVHTSPIPGYTLHGKIGQGGMGAVYKATQNSVNRLVAVKIMNANAVKDPTFVARFTQEARAAGKLSHKNLISAIDVGDANGLYYFVMEFVTGKSCREILNTEGPFPEDRAFELAAQMAEVLSYIHQHQLVHRDIKPENILLMADGTVKLCDLGLAKSTATEEQSLTQTGFAVGTPFFMSPEQCRGEKDVDIRADLYSLGATLYFLVTGRYPFEGKSALDTMHLHQTAPVPDPRRHAAGLNEDFGRVIQKLMSKSRGDRYAEPAHLLAELEKIRSGEAATEARKHALKSHVHQKSHTVRVAVPRPTSKSPLILAGVGVVLIAAVSIAFWGGGREKALDPPPSRPTPPPVAAAPKPEPVPREAAPSALLRAKEAAAKDPNDTARLIPLYEKALAETRGTSLHEEARRGLDAAYRKELELMEPRLRELVQREHFGSAFATLESARRRYAASEWVAGVDARLSTFRSEVLRVYGPIKEQALAARQHGSGQEKAAIDRVASWAMPEYRQDLDRALASVGPKADLPPEKLPNPSPLRPVPPSPPSAKRWEDAMRLAAGRDYPPALAALEGLGADAADLELLRTVQALHAESVQAIAKVPRGQRIALQYWDEGGEVQKIDEAVFRADPFRVEFRKDGAAVVVETGEITADAIAEFWKSRTPRKAAKDGRAAAVLCLLDGDSSSARRQLGAGDLPERYWELGRRLEEERTRPAVRQREDAARRRYYAADREFADPATAADASGHFAELLKESEEVVFVRRNRAAIAARAEGGREFLFFGDEMRGTGTFKISTHAKAASCWTSEMDSDAARRSENAVDIAFSVVPDVEYRCWVWVGGCCMETLAFQAQAADAPDPGAAPPQPVKQGIATITRNHNSHTGPKQPSRWGWVAVPLPKYTSAGPRKVRLLTDQKGFSVGFAFVSALKPAPPKETELRDLEKARVEAMPRAVADASLVGWWRLDERTGTVAQDASRNKNHGSLKNGPTWAAGRTGGGLAFDGEDDHVRVPDSSSLNSIVREFTAAAWVLRHADQEYHRLVVSRQLGTGDENQFWLGFRENQFGFSITQKGGTAGARGPAAPNNEWVHLAGTYDGSTLRLYVNGAEVATGRAQGPLAPCTRPLMIGADEYDDMGGVQEVPKAVIDDVRLYSRALTPAEISALATLRSR